MKTVFKYGETLVTIYKGYNYINDFWVNPMYRGKGYGKRLATYLPYICWLMSCPYDKDKNSLNRKQLLMFYRKLGFKFYKDKYNRDIGFRGFKPTKEILMT